MNMTEHFVIGTTVFTAIYGLGALIWTFKNIYLHHRRPYWQTGVAGFAGILVGAAVSSYGRLVPGLDSLRATLTVGSHAYSGSILLLVIGVAASTLTFFLVRRLLPTPGDGEQPSSNRFGLKRWHLFPRSRREGPSKLSQRQVNRAAKDLMGEDFWKN
jgi:hypothetical protein